MSTKAALELSHIREFTRSGIARSIRIGAGLSLRDVATAVGVSKSTIYRWENGERTPRNRDATMRYGELLHQLLRRGVKR
jgi:DNA-binding transcriptional regulator YiaG